MSTSNHRLMPNLWFFCLIASALLIVGFILGYLNPGSFRAALTPSISQIIKLVDKTHGHDSWAYTFFNIFFHNVLTCILLIFLGFIVGIFPTIMLWTNGLLLGFVISIGHMQKGIPWWKMMVFGILPHGIFEFPALIWAGALGFANGYAMLRTVVPKKQKSNVIAQTTPNRAVDESRLLVDSLWRSIRMLPIIVGLLLIAGLVESSITPHLIQWGIERT